MRDLRDCRNLLARRPAVPTKEGLMESFWETAMYSWLTVDA